MVAEPAQYPTTRKSSRTRDLTREVVSGGSHSFIWRGRGRQPLPHPFDDLSARQGIEVYEKMMTDSQVASTMRLFKTAILEDGMNFTPAITDPAEPDYDIANQIHDEWIENIKYMDTDLNVVLFNMLNAAAYGNKVAEQVYEIYKNRLRLKALKVKPRQSVAFVVDEYLNVIGLLGDTTGVGIVSWISAETQIIPREKFAVLTFQPEDGDPRGTSLLRAAYEPWWRKRQIMPEYLKFLAQFAGPSLFAIAPEDAEMPRPVVDEDDDEISTPIPQTIEEAITATLVNFRNSTAMTLPPGTELDMIKSEGEGKAFIEGITLANLDITKAILVQQLATEESQFMARAAAEVHQDVLATLIRQGKQAVVRMLEQDILRPWVTYNWGPDATEFCPVASLGEVEAEDMVQLMGAVANLMGKAYFAEEHLPWLDRMMGFPVRPAGAKRVYPQREQKVAQPKQQQQTQQPNDQNSSDQNNQNKENSGGGNNGENQGN